MGSAHSPGLGKRLVADRERSVRAVPGADARRDEAGRHLHADGREAEGAVEPVPSWPDLVIAPGQDAVTERSGPG